MRRISFTGLSLAVVVPAVVAVMSACSKDPPPPVAPVASAQPVYPMPGTQPGQPQPAGAPVAGQMATPGPTALACQNDSQCLTHLCNTQFGKCAFPCVSEVDCIQGTTCIGAGSPLAACMPKAPGAP